MIPTQFIAQWKTHAPGTDLDKVEQDLIICRALVAIFSDDFLKENLAFRGGTALHKLYLKPAPRYSEDIDLVQVHQESIGQTIDARFEFFLCQTVECDFFGHGCRDLEVEVKGSQGCRLRA